MSLYCDISRTLNAKDSSAVCLRCCAERYPQTAQAARNRPACTAAVASWSLTFKYSRWTCDPDIAGRFNARFLDCPHGYRVLQSVGMELMYGQFPVPDFPLHDAHLYRWDHAAHSESKESPSNNAANPLLVNKFRTRSFGLAIFRWHLVLLAKRKTVTSDPIPALST